MNTDSTYDNRRAIANHFVRSLRDPNALAQRREEAQRFLDESEFEALKEDARFRCACAAVVRMIARTSKLEPTELAGYLRMGLFPRTRARIYRLAKRIAQVAA
ncbi:MAG: hypothetical protein HKL91_02840 [Candidatus Eremiobacteraeota bacterium]|uniref:Uncharacterized protein n=1 Tax=mine drainage metagenome TaxID=410659 RepID=E6PIM2_9ZZZZ|nr:hypothetical protein [Candidatus Eremiobacteraeota bacterium]